MLSIAAFGIEFKSMNNCEPSAVPPGKGVTRCPSIKTSVAPGSKPRNEIDEAPSARGLDALLFAIATPLAFAIGRFLINSSPVRSPEASITVRVITCTGFGPTSAAVGIREPVTITRSASAVFEASLADSSPGVGVACCALIVAPNDRTDRCRECKSTTLAD